MCSAFVYIKLFFLLLLFLVALCSCGGGNNIDNSEEIIDKQPISKPPAPPPTPPEVGFLDTETEIQIRQEYLDYLIGVGIEWGIDWSVTIDDVWVEQYYGTYNGFIAVSMGDTVSGYFDVQTEVIIDNIKFCYPASGPMILVWGEGQFYGLQEAFDLGLFMREDIENIASLHSEIYCCP